MLGENRKWGWVGHTGLQGREGRVRAGVRGRRYVGVRGGRERGARESRGEAPAKGNKTRTRKTSKL